MNISPEQSLAELACAIPGATGVFHQHRLDFCCGGRQSLREAAAKRGLDPEQLVGQLQALTPSADDEQDWRGAGNVELIRHILADYHEKHRAQLPELIRLARRVEQVHGERPDCPVGLAAHLSHMLTELELHMQKEEQVLFPMLAMGRNRMSDGPVTMMRCEHDQHAAELAKLEALTAGITAPANACNTWRALYLGLDAFRADLMRHIHLENNVLFEGLATSADEMPGAAPPAPRAGCGCGGAGKGGGGCA